MTAPINYFLHYSASLSDKTRLENKNRTNQVCEVRLQENKSSVKSVAQQMGHESRVPPPLLFTGKFVLNYQEKRGNERGEIEEEKETCKREGIN